MLNVGDARTIDDYPAAHIDRLLGVTADVLRSFGNAAGGRHVAIVGGMAPVLHVRDLPIGVKPHVGTADLDLHLSLQLLDGDTADYYDSIIEGLRSLSLKQDHDAVRGQPVLWRWVGQYRDARLEVELLSPTRTRPARPEGAAADTVAESNIGPAEEIRTLPLPYGHLVPADTVTVRRRVATLHGDLDFDFPVAGLTSWLVLKTDAIANRAKGKDAYDVVWLLNALGPESVAETVRASALMASYRDEVVGQLRRLVTDQFRDVGSAGPGLYATFHGDAAQAGRRREAFGTVKAFGAALRRCGVLGSG